VKILIVDDDPLVRSSLGRLLRGRGLYVFLAGGASEALGALDQQDFDAVLSDYQMPGENGLVFLARVAGAYPQIRRALMSGDPGCPRGCASRFFPKPVDVAELLAWIGEAS
jgi:DNA-binding NtrC family response regulator